MNVDNPAPALAHPLFSIGAAHAAVSPASASASVTSPSAAASVVSSLVPSVGASGGVFLCIDVESCNGQDNVDIPCITLHRLAPSRRPSMQLSLPPIAEQENDAEHVEQAQARAKAQQFWMPNDLWRSITPFSARREVLHLRSTNRSVYAQADHALGALTLEPNHIDDFFTSPGFKHVKTLCVKEPDEATMKRLVSHLEKHPRPGMTLCLSTAAISSPVSSVAGRHFSMETMRQLSRLSLAALEIDKVLGFRSAEMLEALTECEIPITLSGAFSRGTLIAASRITSLNKLTIFGMEFDDSLARLFSLHRALKEMLIGTTRDVSPDGIAALAAIPTLQAISVDEWFDRTLIDAASAAAIAANPAIQTLTVRAGQGLAEESCAALSLCQSLTTLNIHFREEMHELGNIATLRHLSFTPSTWAPPVNLDRVSAESIARLPALETLCLPNMKSEAGAVTAILQRSPARALLFEGYYAFDDEELAALQGNTHLRALTFHKGGMPDGVIEAMCSHPTLERLRIMDAEFRRIPGQERLTEVLSGGVHR